MRIAVLGIGLIGGSLAQALHPAHEVVGFDPSEQVRKQAAVWGLPVADDVAVAVRDAELVVLAAPVPINDDLLAQVPAGRLVTDVGSVKMPVVRRWRDLGEPAALVPGHPMAGAETAGWEAAKPELFEGARWVLCPGPWSTAGQWVELCELVLGLGASVVPADPERHDAAVAAISHAPHVVAAALGSAAASAGTAHVARSMSAGSFRDMSRVTASPSEGTAEFCFANRAATARTVRDVMGQLERAALALEDGEAEGFADVLRQGHDARQQYEHARHDVTPDTLLLRLDHGDWAEPLLALGDAGGSVVGLARQPDGSARLDVRRPA